MRLRRWMTGVLIGGAALGGADEARGQLPCGGPLTPCPTETATPAPAATSAPDPVAVPAQAGPVRGGTLTFLTAADVDYIDPGQTYYTFGYTVTNATQRTLYSYAPGDAATPVPDLAAGPPEIAPDRRSFVVRIRPDVRYAPPVDRAVVAADVKYAFERAFSARVASGYATTIFSDLRGAPRTSPRRIKRISGIEAVDATTLRFSLTAPVADTVAAALTLPISAPVPPEYAKSRDARNPSTYDRSPAFTGPYVVAERRPGRVIRLARNPNWDPATDFRPAYLDAITIDQGNQDLTVAARRAASGSRTVCCDAGQLPPGALRSLPADQVATAQSGGTRWIALNTRIKPFNSRAVRRAIVAGMDRTRLSNTRGGGAYGQVATHFLPPDVPGFDAAGGAAGFPELDFLASPGGDRKLSARYFRRAGYRRGRYTGKRRISVVATNALPGKATARSVVRQLRRMGFRLRVRYVPQDELYTRWCGVPRRKVAICPNVGWFRDYGDPQALLEPTFSGGAIRPAGNVNWSQLRVRGIDAAMRRARTVPAGPERDAAWASIDRRITAEAPAVPYLWDTSQSVRSTDVDGVVHAFNGTWDLSHTAVR